MNRRSFLTSSTAVSAGILSGASSPLAAAPAAEGRFQLGSVTYNLLHDMDLETAIQTLEKVGFAAIELRTGHKHGVEPGIDAAARVQVKERFQRSKVRLLSYGSTCEFQSPDQAERRKQIEIGKTFVDLAKDTGAMAVKVRPNGLPKGVPLDTTVGNIGAGLRELGDYGQAKGIEIWMEVHGSKTQEFPLASRILQTANHKNVGACWNSNPTDVVDGSLKQAFAALGPYIRNCHISELTSGYPYQEFFRLLRESGYSRYTLAEVAESKEPERFMVYYRALWEKLNS
ncbi:MAG TPA: TIM barrel protein [Bryobacteraceae bacterium]|nr:TIM barrel protein [Bryobacteraceae bacterium]